MQDVVCFRQSSDSCGEREKKKILWKMLKCVQHSIQRCSRVASAFGTCEQKRESLLNASDSGFDVWQQKEGKNNDRTK